MAYGKWHQFWWGFNVLTHWGRVTHICISERVIIGSDNGLSPIRRQAIIYTNADLLSIEALETKFNEIRIEIQNLSFMKIHLNMSSAKRRPFCLGLNVLTHWRNCHHFEDDIFKCIALNDIGCISINISLTIVPMGQIHNIPALVQIMAWRRPGDKPLSESMMLYWHIYVSLCLNDLRKQGGCYDI